MRLRFTKMQGLGNDFVVIDGISQHFDMTMELAKHLADRHFGVGCDQILLVERSSSADADFRYRIWNQDGGEVEQCGNGARCFVRFVHDKKMTEKRGIRVETKGGIIVPRLEETNEITVDMGAPVFEPKRIPFESNSIDTIQSLDVAGSIREITAVSMGNPHAVQVVVNVDTAPVDTEGPLIEHHSRFLQRVNAGFMQVVDRTHIRLRVWERGAGETLACGTGACAAVVAGIKRGLLDSVVKVETHGGELSISWSGGENHVFMTGPAVAVFDGEIEINQ